MFKKRHVTRRAHNLHEDEHACRQVYNIHAGLYV